MQRTTIAVILALVLASCGSGAQTADDIIAKNVKARGGYDKIISLHNVVFEGITISKSGQLTVKNTYEHLKGLRSDYTINGKTGYSILTPTGGWTYNPFSDPAPLPMPDSMLKSALVQLDIQGAYVDYKSKGYQATYEGMDTAYGKKCHKIKLVKKGEGDKIYFFDDAYLLQKTIVYRLGSPGENYYFDYRKNADGYLFSYRRSFPGTQVIFDKVTTNVALPASIFQPGN